MNRLPAGYIEPAGGGQFYDLYPAYVGPLGWRPVAGRLVLYWYPVYADGRQRQTTSRRPVGP